jgi:transposase
MAMSVSVFSKSEACTIFTMPQLNELQKSIIRTRLEDGMSIRHIANEINVDKNTILLAKRKIEETGTIGRKRQRRHFGNLMK